ncbi:MAG: helix-turn-helix transcriptional regulator [Sphingobium sp.]|nr:helix-turn-helix transcriptional regulator [Sphingobium sp.]
MADDPPASGGERFERLTQVHMTCLRLAATGLTSKEIAQRTDLTYRTVQQYLFLATNEIGAANSREAARLFVAWEELNRVQLNAPELVENAQSVIVGQPANEVWPEAETPEHVMCDSAMGTDVPMARSGWSVAAPPIGGRVNGLKLDERIYAILRVAAYAVIAMSVFVLVLTGILHLYG